MLFLVALVVACALILLLTVPDLDRPRNEPRETLDEPGSLPDLEPRSDGGKAHVLAA